MKTSSIRCLAAQFAASVISFTQPQSAFAQASPGPHEMLPFQDGFIIEAFFDLQTNVTGQIADWTGFSGTSWVSPNAYNDHIGSDYSVQTGTQLFATTTGTVVEVATNFVVNNHTTY